MTLDEMIKHHIDMAKLQENRAERWKEQRDDYAVKLHNRLAADHRQLAEWLKDYKGLKSEMIDLLLYVQMLETYKEEAKRLLKLAVLDFSNMYDHIYDCDGMCESCPIHGNRDECDKWHYTDEAEKLLKEESK